MKFLHYSKNGNIIGFYSKDIHEDNIPDPNIEITEEKWQQMLSKGIEKFRVDLTSGKVLDYIKPLNERIIELKLIKISQFNQLVKLELSELDWKVLRHIEQKYLDISTSITDEEYKDLLIEKQEIRDKLNGLKKAVENSETIEEVNNILW